MKGVNHLIIGCLIVFTAVIYGLTAEDALAAGDPKAGEKIYNGPNNCHVCHGPQGKAVLPGVPNYSKGEVAGGKKLVDRTDAELKDKIINGTPKPSNPAAPPMPPYGGGPKLTDQQLDDVIAYIRSLGPKAK